MADLFPSKDDGMKRAQWYARMITKYPRLSAFDAHGVSRPKGQPTKPPRGPFSVAEVVDGLDKNIREAAAELGYWSSELAEFARFAEHGGDEEKWERQLLASMCSRYRAEQAHWREYATKWMRR